jgi:uroporphyrinogen III methyltransferase/synthase
MPAPDASLLRDAARHASHYDWVVFTSVNGVRAFFDALDAEGLDARAFGHARVSAIGPATSAALSVRGIRADLMPAEYRGEAVAEAILERSGNTPPRRVLLPRAEVARDALPKILQAAGAKVDVVAAYRTEAALPAAFDAVRERLRARALDVITFTSPSTVERLVAGLGEDALPLLSTPCIAAIGPITADAVRALGLSAQVIASEYTAEGLIDALIHHFAKKR